MKHLSLLLSITFIFCNSAQPKFQISENGDTSSLKKDSMTNSFDKLKSESVISKKCILNNNLLGKWYWKNESVNHPSDFFLEVTQSNDSIFILYDYTTKRGDLINGYDHENDFSLILPCAELKEDNKITGIARNYWDGILFNLELHLDLNDTTILFHRNIIKEKPMWLPDSIVFKKLL